MNIISTGAICWKILKSFREGKSRFFFEYFISFILVANCCYFPGILAIFPPIAQLHIKPHTTQNSSNLSEEGLTLETLAFNLFTLANLRFNSVDSTKLPCYTLSPTQHHSFFRNLPPSIDVVQLSTRETSIFEVLHLRSCFFLFNFNRPSKTRFKKRVCMQGILSARFTLTGILSLL